MKAKILVLLCGMFVAGLASAECPTSLSEAEYADCMDIESSGINYQEWKQNQNDMANDSTISPTTGEDVRDIAPAADAPEPDTMMGD
jgi:hypothetical protein